jgi:hypothetical protein
MHTDKGGASLKSVLSCFALRSGARRSREPESGPRPSPACLYAPPPTKGRPVRRGPLTWKRPPMWRAPPETATLVPSGRATAGGNRARGNHAVQLDPFSICKGRQPPEATARAGQQPNSSFSTPLLSLQLFEHLTPLSTHTLVRPVVVAHLTPHQIVPADHRFTLAAPNTHIYSSAAVYIMATDQ